MIREIVRDEEFLKIPSRPATQEDIPILVDLIETIVANGDRCVGMAANMIGESVAIIVFEENDDISFMFNPEIIKASEPYSTEEGCLSLEGVRPTKRYNKIKVQYQNIEMQTRLKTYTGWTAQIIQHEIDHIKGIII